jgi:hypothetical protein
MLREVLASNYKGPRAVFSEVHVLRAMLAIGTEGPVGRGKLGTLVGLGQGEVRTLIKRMKEKGLIMIEPGGCLLSKKGEREFHSLREKIPWSSPVNARALGIGGECSAILLRGVAPALRKGIEQRDAAVRVGAIGAFSAVFAQGRFILPGQGEGGGGGDCEKDGPGELWAAARSALPKDGDALIVVGADSMETAELGALAAALTLI